MAQQYYRANLSAAIFPMALSRAGRSVIVPQIDQNYDRRVDPTGEQKTPGIPQALYLENVLPTVEGYQSVGYREEFDMPGSGETNILVIRNTQDFKSLNIAFRAGSSTAYYLDGSSWLAITIVGHPSTPIFTTRYGRGQTYSSAVVNGKTYIWTGQDLWELVVTLSVQELRWIDGITPSSGTVTPPGVLNNVVGIAASYGYLILLKDDFTSVSVLWSSLLTPTDFVPSLVTGAGGGFLAQAEGRAMAITGTSWGFLIFCSGNAVSAVYTGNARFPFKLKAIDMGSGIDLGFQFYCQSDSESAVCITRQRGVYIINSTQATQVMPEVTEFLERFRSTEDLFDYTTNTFSIGEALNAKASILGIYRYDNRYIILSVGNGIITVNATYEYCIVFDTLLNRYGRLKIKHTSLFDAVKLISTGNEGLKLGFFNEFDNSTYTWDLTTANSSFGDPTPPVKHKGVILLGRFQGVRSRTICMEGVEVESPQDAYLSDPTTPNFEVVLYPSLEGKDLSTPVIPYDASSPGLSAVKKYLCHTESRNLSVLIKGAFDLSTVELKFHLGGFL